MIATVDRLVELILESNLLDSDRRTALVADLQPQHAKPYQLAKDLLDRAWLTDYQLEEIIKGRGQHLVLGAYILLEVVGKGSMGTVFKARRQQDGGVVALKIIREDRRGDTQALYRFRREVVAVNQLSHPNIVAACDADEVGMTHYYAMEFVEGINLDVLIRRVRQLPIGPACDYLRQAALGLQHAQERNLIHRDIKPGNLMITTANGQQSRWGTVKILDLGLVRLEQKPAHMDLGTQLTRTGLSLGTVDYMAPEQVEDPHAVDIRADLYSLGCTFYEMLTGQPPFTKGTPVDKLIAHRAKQPDDVRQLQPAVPAAVAAVVARLLAKEPGDRYQAPNDLAAELETILDQLDPALRPTDWQPPTDPDADDEPAAPPAGPPAEAAPGNVMLHYYILGAVMFVLTIWVLLMYL